MARKQLKEKVNLEPFSNIVKAGKKKPLGDNSSAPSVPSLPEALPAKNLTPKSSKKLKVKSNPKTKKKLRLKDLL